MCTLYMPVEKGVDNSVDNPRYVQAYVQRLRHQTTPYRVAPVDNLGKSG